jgi:hypothetical protein
MELEHSCNEAQWEVSCPMNSLLFLLSVEAVHGSTSSRRGASVYTDWRWQVPTVSRGDMLRPVLYIKNWLTFSKSDFCLCFDIHIIKFSLLLFEGIITQHLGYDPFKK